MISNVELLNIIGEVDNIMKEICNELTNLYSPSQARVNISFYGVDRAKYPKSPIGVEWEIDINSLIEEKYFTFDIANEFDLWSIDGYVSAQKNLEVLDSFIEVSDKHLDVLLKDRVKLLGDFKENCIKYIRENKTRNV